jgi:hypothetical protein
MDHLLPRDAHRGCIKKAAVLIACGSSCFGCTTPTSGKPPEIIVVKILSAGVFVYHENSPYSDILI